VLRVACGVWLVACGVWRVACGVWLFGNFVGIFVVSTMGVLRNWKILLGFSP